MYMHLNRMIVTSIVNIVIFNHFLLVHNLLPYLKICASLQYVYLLCKTPPLGHRGDRAQNYYNITDKSPYGRYCDILKDVVTRCCDIKKNLSATI